MYKSAGRVYISCMFNYDTDWYAYSIMSQNQTLNNHVIASLLKASEQWIFFSIGVMINITDFIMDTCPDN